MGLSEQLTHDERERWESFIQRLGASVRASDAVRILDLCDRTPKLSSSCRSAANLLLMNELTIAVVHRHRGVLTV